ncbi:MAG: ArsR/SmtB family transcription factor [Litorivicinaceae bacterium]
MSEIAINQLQALGQPTRLALFRTLVRAEPDGLLVGELADTLGLKPNTTSMSLNRLLIAGLVKSMREGKSVRYRADLAGVESLVSYLLEDCCAGNTALCTTIRCQLEQAC